MLGYLKLKKKGSSIIIIRNKSFKNFNTNIQLVRINCKKFYETQGNNFLFKKNYLIARLNIVSKIFRKSIPVYDTKNVGDADFSSYLNSFYLYSITFLASKKYLWWLLIFGVNLLEKIRSL